MELVDIRDLKSREPLNAHVGSTPTSGTKICPPTRIRTWDLLLKREQLYQLSYGRFVVL